MTIRRFDERCGNDVGLLVSVRNGIEAEIALQGGVDWIDVKEPLRGALGAADLSAVEEVVKVVDSRVPVSVALGELLSADTTENGADTAENGRTGELAASSNLGDGIAVAKYGLAGCARQPDWPGLWRRAVDCLPAPVRPVAVFYADWRTAGAPDPADILKSASRLNCQAALIDTFDKSAGGIFDMLSLSSLQQLIGQLRQRRMKVVLGGSLTLATLENAVTLHPDYIALRGAACAGDRSSPLNLDLVRQITQHLAILTHRHPRSLADVPSRA